MTTHLLVAGLINIETTVKVEAFPIPYRPQHFPFFGVQSSVSGVAFNVSTALTTLDNRVTLLAMIANDTGSLQVRAALQHAGIDDRLVIASLPQTPQSAILYDEEGRRAIFTDLKDIQERTYPAAPAEAAIAAADFCVLCNINFARPMLAMARRAGKPIATDVHAIAELDDAFNADFMAAARVLFMSHERLPTAPEEWARVVLAHYRPEVLVIGLGSQGALLGVRRDNFLGRFPAATVRPVVSTVGAGDSLFSAFVDGYARTGDPYGALRRAIFFAAHKIGTAGGADGFLSTDALNDLVNARSTAAFALL